METTPNTNLSPGNVALPLLGAAAGGVAGYFICGWLLRQGFYAMALPGALLGVGCGIFVKRKLVPLSVGCGIAAVLLGFWCEWRLVPFVADSSLGYFLSHLKDLRTMTFVMIALGGVFAFWFSLGRTRRGIPN